MPILVSGSLAYDHIMDFPDRFKNHIHPESIHILNVCFTVEKMEKSWGGTAGSIAHNLKLMGVEPIVFSSLGKDGKEYLNYLEKKGIKTDNIKIVQNKFTASCFITTDKDDNQITAFYNGALDSEPELKLARIGKNTKWAIISPTKKDVMLKHLSKCKRMGLKIIFDPGQQIPAFSGNELKKAIEQSDILFGNDYEIKMILKKTNWDKKEVLKRAEILVTTYGERGSRIETRDKQEILVEVCRPKRIVDPTGAGDAYRAGFLVGLEKGYNLRICARSGSVAASYAIEKYGTQAHSFSRKEFEGKYKRTYKEEISL